MGARVLSGDRLPPSPVAAPAAPSTRSFLVAALAFGALVFLTPGVAWLFRAPINRGGALGLVTLAAVAVLLLALSAGCLALFMRGHHRALVPPDLSRVATVVPDAERALMVAFGFDPDDLGANRAGRLSPRQHANLGASRVMMAIMATVMLGVTYLSLALMPVAMGTGLVSGSTTRAADAAGYLVGVGIINALIGGSLVYGYRQMRDQLHGRMSVAEGPAGEPSYDVEGPAATRSILTSRVGAVLVPLTTDAQVEALRTGVRYRIFHLAGPLARVLSIEPIER